MVSQIESQNQSTIIYPESDGKPMADNTKQFRWITFIHSNLDWLFANNETVFVAGDLLWYPVEGNPKITQAPDVMVIFGVPKGDRGSYKQWQENNIAPQVVFEILSPSNTQKEMYKKLFFYDRHGVEEYYIYDPDKNDLSGLLRSEGNLEVIDSMNNWVSPRLGIRFDMSGQELQLYYPSGEIFQSLEQTKEQLQQTEEQLRQKETALQEEQKRSELLAEKLREMGINPDELK